LVDGVMFLGAFFGMVGQPEKGGVVVLMF